MCERMLFSETSAKKESNRPRASRSAAESRTTPGFEASASMTGCAWSKTAWPAQPHEKMTVSKMKNNFTTSFPTRSKSLEKTVFLSCNLGSNPYFPRFPRGVEGATLPLLGRQQTDRITQFRKRDLECPQSINSSARDAKKSKSNPSRPLWQIAHSAEVFACRS